MSASRLMAAALLEFALFAVPFTLQPVIPKTDAPPSVRLAVLDGPLAADTVYAQDLPEGAMVDAFPAGLVTVEQKTGTGPFHVKAKWWDGKAEWRTFKNPVFVEPVPGAKGTVTLVVVPAGAKSTSEWKTTSIDVAAGTGPPVSPSLRTDLRAAYAADKSTKKAAQLAALAKVWAAGASQQFLDGYDDTATWANVFEALHKTTSASLAQTDLQGVRLVIEKYTNTKISNKTTALLDKATAATVFGEIASALDSLAKSP